ncbi:MAG: hypothetical protein FJ008_03665 [Chloroflexi bacterium]|nr:hypothetical protein [Chloroflexota bacterium]
MDKVCVFCGQKPEHKNNEHIIPLWLIELTGNPNRIAEFGDKDFAKPELGKRAFSFDSFRFPSCESCNTKYAELEGYVKPTIEKIIDTDFISAPEFNTLLDWFDKIRVGLWLGFRYLDKDPAGITPSFYIEQRLRASDRVLVIFKGDGDKKGLNLTGCDQPSFVYTPSCFGLRINNYCFVNISCFGLLSRRIGFPYIAEPFQMEKGRIEGQFVAGRNRIMNPILKKRFSIQGTEVYQPIFSGVIINPAMMKKYYDTEYVRINSMVWDEGIGKIFMNSTSGLQEYPMSPSKIWIPKTTYAFDRLLFEMQLLVLEWQTYVDSLAPSFEKLPYKIRQQMKRQNRFNKHYNTRIIEILREKAERLGMPPLID